eukprot:scaffold1900_cov123-Cylindrotheca_fusiformis.AAC.40
MQDVGMNRYFAMVPRGLETLISDSLSNASGPELLLQCLGEEESPRILQNALQKLSEKTSSKNRLEKDKAVRNWCRSPVGSLPLHNKLHVSVGYTGNGKSSWTCPGQVSGSVWLSAQTQHHQLLTSRCVGPLLASIHHGKVSSTDKNQSLSQIVSEIGEWTLGVDTNYRRSFDNALNLWKDHARKVWKGQLTQEDHSDLISRIDTNALRFRLSCVRENSDVPYTRAELLKSLMDHHGDTLIPNNWDWKVSMTNFDLEIVLVVLANGTIALGIALQPYSFCKSKSFSIGGVPPDVTPPYIGGSVLTNVCRLRPTTAHLLLELANVQHGDLVVDPCSGIGTIPVEAEGYFPVRSIGIGGDIVLDHASICSAVCAMESIAKQQQQQSSGAGTKDSSQLSVAWDAAMVPLRTGIVDAVVSDLPFGQMCLSSSTLNQLLPLIIVECARILVPSTGRMVVLCGSPDGLLRALEESSDYWKRPCTMVAPVNIGGLLAWVVRIERSEKTFNMEETSSSSRNTISNRIRSMAKKRDNRRRHAGKKRRIQSKS